MAKVQCPTLFIVGKDDQMTPPKAAQSLVRRAQAATVAQVNAGHAMMSEAPEDVLAALKAFLKC